MHEVRTKWNSFCRSQLQLCHSNKGFLNRITPAVLRAAAAAAVVFGGGNAVIWYEPKADFPYGEQRQLL
jgi:hypothetical protein